MLKNKEFIPEQLLKRITGVLDKAGVPYMITGALSVIFYGRPRASHDIDLVIEAQKKDFPKIKQAFSSLIEEFLVDIEAIGDAIAQKQSFNIVHLQSLLKIDFWLLKDEEYDKKRFERRKKIKVFGREMYFSTPEDTILIKLLWYKQTKIEKHLIDAAFVYRVQEKKLDKGYLEEWASEQKTRRILGSLKNIDLSLHY